MFLARLKSATGRPEFWIVAALTAVAALLHFATLTNQSYWLDEATTVHEIRLSFGGLLHAVHSDETTPPLYFILAWVWSRIFGSGEAGLRSLSAVCAIAMVPIAYAAARELVDRLTGVVTALLITVSPLMLWYAQEARSYMLLTTLLAASLWLWARARRTGARADLAGWAILSALAVGTHFFAGFLVAPEGLWLLYQRRTRAVLAACAFVAVVQLALLPLAFGDTRNLLNWLMGFSLHTRLGQIPILFGASQLYLSPNPLASDGLLFAAIFVVICGALIIWGSGGERRRSAGVPALLAAIAIVLPVILALAGRDYVVPRNLIGVFLPLVVVLAAAATAPRARPFGLVLVALAVVGFVAADISTQTNSAFERPDWRGVATALGPARTPRAVIIDAGDVGEEPLTVYLPGTANQFSYGGTVPAGPAVDVGEIDVVGEPYQTVPSHLPAGVSLLSDGFVDRIQVARFLINPHWTRTRRQLRTAGSGLLPGARSSGAAVLIQR